MKRIGMIQNSDDWYKMRNDYLGASDSNIIMGQSKFRTPLELWKIKTGEPQKENKSANFIQAKGHRMEEKMRNIMNMLYDTTFEPIVVESEDEEYDFLMCSLDGYSEEIGCVWENKYCGKDDYEKVSNGQMLMHYYPQVQHQLLLTGAPFCVFSVITDNKESESEKFPYVYSYIEVKPDYKYMKESLLPELKKFWDNVKTKTPPELSKNDRLNLDDDDELAECLSDYRSLKEQIEKHTDMLKGLESKIYGKLGKASKAECMGVKITKSKSEDKEVFDYKKFESENPIEDKYKKIQKGRITKRITFPK